MTDLTRRDFLKYMGLGAAGVAGAVALAACGGNNANTATNSEGGNTASNPGTGSSAGGSSIDTAETVTSLDLTTSGEKNGNVTMGPDSDKLTMVAVAAKTFETLDPFFLGGSMNARIKTMLWTPLWDMPYSGSEDKGIAVKEWSFEDDGKTVVFELYDNIVDMEGNNYTMDDMMWFADYTVNVLGKNLRDVLSVESTGKYTGKLHMKQKYFPGYLSSSVSIVCVTQKAYEAAGDEGFRSNPVTTGRYKAIDFVSGAYAVFQQTYKYWGDLEALTPQRAANVDVCRYDVITEESQIATALRTNTIQAYDIQVSTAEDFYADPGNVNVFKFPALFPSFLMFNMYPGSKFADNKALREAVAYAINWEDVAYAATMGYGSSTGVIGHEALAGYNKDWETDGSAIHYDPDLAKQKLEEAGYKPGELTLKFSYNQTPNEFAVMQENLSQIGINLEMALLDEVTYLDKRNRADLLEWDLMGSDFVPKGFVTNILFGMGDITSAQQWDGQICGAHDEEVGELVLAARYGTQEDIDKAYHALMDRLWYIPRFNGNGFIGAYNKIERVVVDSSQELCGQACLFADDYDVFYK